MQKKLFIFFLLTLASCAGEDYTPVYFPGAESAGAAEGKPSGADLSLGQALCDLELTAQLCVKIKGKNINVGTEADRPLCAPTPPIPLKIQGEKILLRGSDFPDIPVSVDIKGVATPMTINGKGDTDGSANIAEGSWTPDGDITIQDFSFYINVLGMSGEIPHIDLTTDEAKSVPELEALAGQSADDSGKVTLVAATVLSPLFPAADAFLLGASLQASFEGTISPPLSECAAASGIAPALKVVKLRPQGGGRFLEEPLPEGNILEISQGTFIAAGPEDRGPDFEAKAQFKVSNEGDQTVALNFPSQLGPFYFNIEGQTERHLAPKQSMLFQILFRPEAANIKAPGLIKENFSLGPSRFYLVGVALTEQGRLSLQSIDETGQPLSTNVDQIALASVSVLTAPAKGYFQCQTQMCEGQTAITACQPCENSAQDHCRLEIMDTAGHPLVEVTADCKPLDPDSTPRLQLYLSKEAGPVPTKQRLTIQNHGIADLEMKSIQIEEVENSQSTGEFSFALTPPQNLPILLPAAEKNSDAKVVITVTYLPKDLIGFSGSPAAPGQSVLDKAYLVVATNGESKKILLTGKTEIAVVPYLQAYFATPTGFKTKTGFDTFTFEEVTGETRDLAYPVFLNVSEQALHGIRITEIKTSGADANHFEWLDTMEEVTQRQPTAGTGRRCSIPILDSQTGRMIDEQFNLHFVAMGSQGFDLKPGTFSINNLPLFGCINFHPELVEGQAPQRIFQADLIVTGLELDAQGKLIRANNAFRQTSLVIPLVAAMHPLKGKMVLRIPQTIAAILNPQAPTMTAVAAKREAQPGQGASTETTVLLGSIIFDPFDEMEITDSQGRVVSKPNDGMTAVFRALDTLPTSQTYAEEMLFDHATLLHDSMNPDADGIFYDYGLESLPDPLRTNGWRIFTGALSYPGPLSPRSPISQEGCEVIDPCDPEDLRQFAESGIGTDGKGACAFFYASGGRYHSPAFEPVIQGENYNLCDHRDQPQEIYAMDTGHYSVNGSITFEDIGFRFWGPTYVHNPHGPLGFIPPLDEVFHIGFTTDMLKPATGPNQYNVLPDEKIDIGRQEYKINLTETDLSSPALCPKNTLNRTIGGRRYSSWRYFAPLLFKDEAGTIPAGCPEPSPRETESPFSGGTAFLKGRRIDPVNKTFTIVSGAKFGSREELTSAFKNVMIFVIINGWVCDPQGAVENFEGKMCFDPAVNPRDEQAQISILED